MKKVFALVDCNNFYASCERLFRPELNGKPVVVLSNNDGCIVARSNEAKALGIPMGAPLFKVKHLVARHNVHVFSSNYALYGDLSHRVMDVLGVYGVVDALGLAGHVHVVDHGFKRSAIIEHEYGPAPFKGVAGMGVGDQQGLPPFEHVLGLHPALGLGLGTADLVPPAWIRSLAQVKALAVEHIEGTKSGNIGQDDSVLARGRIAVHGGKRTRQDAQRQLGGGFQAWASGLADYSVIGRGGPGMSDISFQRGKTINRRMPLSPFEIREGRESCSGKGCQAQNRAQSEDSPRGREITRHDTS